MESADQRDLKQDDSVNFANATEDAPTRISFLISEDQASPPKRSLAELDIAPVAHESEPLSRVLAEMRNEDIR